MMDREETVGTSESEDESAHGVVSTLIRGVLEGVVRKCEEEEEEEGNGGGKADDAGVDDDDVMNDERGNMGKGGQELERTEEHVHTEEAEVSLTPPQTKQTKEEPETQVKAAEKGEEQKDTPRVDELRAILPESPRRPLELGDWSVDFAQRIGRGSYANVWKATSTRTDTPASTSRSQNTTKPVAVAAVKEVLLSQLSDKLVESLESEVNILKKVTHVNIVSLYDIYKRPGKLFLVLEYCGGGDLSSFLRRNGRLKEATVKRFMAQLSSGLGAMRQLSLVHRDLKPQNLLLTSRNGEDAVLKIGDFGFARYIQPHGMAETLCGSPLYMAPEILMMNKYDAKADLWSVGAIMFEMLAGRPPFAGNNHLELLRNIEKSGQGGGGWQLPPKVSYACSSKCKALLRGLLQRRPVSRISYEELFAHPFFEGYEDAIMPHTAAATTPQQQQQQQQQHQQQSTRPMTSTATAQVTVARIDAALPYGRERSMTDAMVMAPKSLQDGREEHADTGPSGMQTSDGAGNNQSRTTAGQDAAAVAAGGGRAGGAPSQRLDLLERFQRFGIKTHSNDKAVSVASQKSERVHDHENESDDSPNFRRIGSVELLGDYVVVDEDFDEAKSAIDGDMMTVDAPVSSVLGFPAALSPPPDDKDDVRDRHSMERPSEGVSAVGVGDTNVVSALDAAKLSNDKRTAADIMPSSRGSVSVGSGTPAKAREHDVSADEATIARIVALESAGVALSEAVVPSSTRNSISTVHAELSLSLLAAEIINAAMALARHLPHGQGEPRRRRLRADLEAALNRARAAGRTLAASEEVLNASVLPNVVAVAYDAALGFIRQGAVEELVGGGRNGDKKNSGGDKAPPNAAPPPPTNASYAKAAAILHVLRDEAPSLPLAPPFRPDDNDRAVLSRLARTAGRDALISLSSSSSVPNT